MPLRAHARRPLSLFAFVSLVASCAPTPPPAGGDGRDAAEAADDAVLVTEDAAQQRTDVVAPRPDVVAPRPDVVAPGPDVVAPGPDVVAPAPDVVAPRPDVVTPAPDVVAPRPDVVTPAPDATSDAAGGNPLDSGFDAGTGAGRDVTSDAPVDARSDAPADVAPDAGADASSDVVTSCPGTQRQCGGACVACPTEGVATTLCSGPFCVAATCGDGYGLSGGACTARTCPAGQVYCTSRCAACPSTGVVSTRCVGTGACGASACAAGYELNAATSECVTAGIVFELVAATGVTTFDLPGLALGIDGTPYVAFATPLDAGDRIVVTRARIGGVWRSANADRYVTEGGGGPFALRVDPMANLHLAFRNRGVVYRSYDPAGALRVTNDLGFGDTPALALDASVNAHLVSVNFPRVEYRRTFAGSWLAPVSVPLSLAYEPDIAVDASEVAHLGMRVFASNQWSLTYMRAASGILSPPAQTVVPMFVSQLRVFADTGGAPEFWFTASDMTPDGYATYYRSVITAGAPSAPVRWAASTPRTVALIGARGPRGFAALVQDASGYLLRTGPAAGATASTPLALPRNTRAVGRAIYDAAGSFHVLAVRDGALFYLRTR